LYIIENKMPIPTGAKIIAVLYYIGAGLSIIFGLFFLVGAGAISSFLGEIVNFGTSLFIVIGIILIGLGVLNFFILYFN